MHQGKVQLPADGVETLSLPLNTHSDCRERQEVISGCESSANKIWECSVRLLLSADSRDYDFLGALAESRLLHHTVVHFFTWRKYACALIKYLSSLVK